VGSSSSRGGMRGWFTRWSPRSEGSNAAASCVVCHRSVAGVAFSSAWPGGAMIFVVFQPQQGAISAV
jgi:hypothetical protein